MTFRKNTHYKNIISNHLKTIFYVGSKLNKLTEYNSIDANCPINIIQLKFLNSTVENLILQPYRYIDIGLTFSTFYDSLYECWIFCRSLRY